MERNEVLYEGEPLPPTSSVGRLVSKFHQDQLVAALAQKKIHGVFYNTNQKELSLPTNGSVMGASVRRQKRSYRPLQMEWS